MTLAALAFAAAVAQQPPSFAISVESVYVDVFVTRDNRPVTGLTAADFELKDDGVRRGVELVGTESLPATTWLVLDASSSVGGEKLRQLEQAVRGLVEGMQLADEAGLVAFSEEVRVLARPTSDRGVLADALARVSAQGATAVHDGLFSALVLASERPRAAIVLFTDGEDNMSWTSLGDLARALERSNVLLQVVGVVPPAATRLEPQYPVGDRGVRRSPDRVEPAYVHGLRRLAESTGGRFWNADTPGDLVPTFATLLESMRHRYVLRFEPDTPRRPGLHTLDVKLKRGGARLRCRGTYFVGGQVLN